MFSARELLVLQNVKELYDMHLMFFCRQYFGTRYRTEPDRCCDVRRDVRSFFAHASTLWRPRTAQLLSSMGLFRLPCTVLTQFKALTASAFVARLCSGFSRTAYHIGCFECHRVSIMMYSVLCPVGHETNWFPSVL